MNAGLRELLKRAVRRAGLHVQVYRSGNFIPLAYWDSDPAFAALWRQLEGHTLVEKRRCYMLYQYARQAATLAGAVAEVGVYRGGTARLLAQTLPTATLHLFDTFGGMPSTDPAHDTHHQAGDFAATSLAAVQHYLADCPNAHFYPGFFPATAEPVVAQQFRLAHIDVDIYQSTWDCCTFFYPRLVAGGLLVFDDYGLLTCPGVRQAVDTFFAQRPEVPVYLPTGQAVVHKLA